MSWSPGRGGCRCVAGRGRARAAKGHRRCGRADLALASYDLKAMGFVVEEFFLASDAASYKLVGEAKADGA